MLETEKSATIDVYTLAASLFYLVTGDTPTPCLARKMLGNELIEPKRINSRISDRLNQAIVKGLELEPKNRPQSMKEWVGLFPNPSDERNISEVELKPSIRVDYSKLSDLLKAGKWREADAETRELMIYIRKICFGKYPEKEFVDFMNFPCMDFRTIDSLWIEHSNGKFGFSVQKRIHRLIGRIKPYYNKDNIYQEFIEKVGWYKKEGWLGYSRTLNYYEMKFDISAPEGHLPLLCRYSLSRNWQGGELLSSLIVRCEEEIYSRLDSCKL